MKWSSFQENIFAWSKDDTKRHLGVKAGAGCGKTSTIVELYKRIKAQEPNAKVQFMAFNKKISVELAKHDVPASTMNSFGFQCVRAEFPRIKLDTNKLRNLCKNARVNYKKIGFVRRIVDLLKAYLVPMDGDLAGQIKFLAEEFDLTEVELDKELIDQIKTVFTSSLRDTYTIDFSDQICYPYYLDLHIPKFDYVIIDEAQDLSPNKLELVSRAVDKHFIYVGDPLQAIYGFCGADAESMDKIEQRFSPVVKSLPVTYRCGKRIVQEVHNLGVAPKDFQAGPDNHEGEVRSVTFEEYKKQVKPKEFVLCRTTAPLIRDCFDFIKNGVRAQIIGRDIGAKLISLLEKINKYSILVGSVSEMEIFCAKFSEYRRIEVGKLLAAEKDTQADILEDQLDCLFVFTESAQTIGEMCKKIEQMFDDTVNPYAITLSTIHKAKGLEADVVWALPSKTRPSRKEKQQQEEKNLLYVMVTRAKNQFNWVIR